jgi:hypothetical protein
MSPCEPYPRGKQEFAGAIDDLIAQIEMERRSRPPTNVTYDTWGGEEDEAQRQPGCLGVDHATAPSGNLAAVSVGPTRVQEL